MGLVAVPTSIASGVRIPFSRRAAFGRALGQPPPGVLLRLSQEFIIFRYKTNTEFFFCDEESPPGVLLIRGAAFGRAPAEPPPGGTLCSL